MSCENCQSNNNAPVILEALIDWCRSDSHPTAPLFDGMQLPATTFCVRIDGVSVCFFCIGLTIAQEMHRRHLMAASREPRCLQLLDEDDERDGPDMRAWDEDGAVDDLAEMAHRAFAAARRRRAVREAIAGALREADDIVRRASEKD